MGATPIALTDCLNFGNPEKPEVYYQLEECVKGMSAASSAFGAPVISGNVSLYNESRGRDIYPTPIIGALGLLDDVTAHTTMAFKNEGDIVVLLGCDEVRGEPADSLAGSEYLELVHDKVVGQPSIDLDLEAAVQRACRRGRRRWHTSTPPTTAPTEAWPSPSPRAASPGTSGSLSSFAMIRTMGRHPLRRDRITHRRLPPRRPANAARTTMLRRGCTLSRTRKGRGKPCSHWGVASILISTTWRTQWSGGLERAVGGAEGSLGVAVVGESLRVSRRPG